MADGDDLGAVAQQLVVCVQANLALVVDRNHAQLGALGLGQLLPGHDVCVVLQVADDDLVACAHVLAAPGFGHQVDGLGRAAHEDDFVHVGGVDEAAHHFAGVLVGIGGAGGQRVGGAVDVGVLVRVEVRNALDHLAWLVRGGGIVQPDQLLAVDALLQDGKVAAHGLHVKAGVAVGLGLRCAGLLPMGMGLGRGDKTAGQLHRIDKVELRGGGMAAARQPGRRRGGCREQARRDAGDVGRAGGRPRVAQGRHCLLAQCIQPGVGRGGRTGLGHAIGGMAQAGLIGGQGGKRLVGYAVAGHCVGAQRFGAVAQGQHGAGGAGQQVGARNLPWGNGRAGDIGGKACRAGQRRAARGPGGGRLGTEGGRGRWLGCGAAGQAAEQGRGQLGQGPGVQRCGGGRRQRGRQRGSLGGRQRGRVRGGGAQNRISCGARYEKVSCLHALGMRGRWF